MTQQDAIVKQSWYRRTGKRLGDAALAAVMLTVLSPLLAIIAGCVWSALGRPVLFRQPRAGKDGAPFTLVKFRSMRTEPDVGTASLSPDERLTAFGRWLRKTSMDELPELWNVARGEMSLVGPRPLLMRYNDRYSSIQARRLTVRPGLTGWAQINGRNDSTWTERLDHDVWYVDHMSLALDLRILFRTIPTVLRGRGVNPRDDSFMPEFTGESIDSVSNNPL